MVVTLIKRTDVDGGDCVDFQIVEEVQRFGEVTVDDERVAGDRERERERKK